MQYSARAERKILTEVAGRKFQGMNDSTLQGTPLRSRHLLPALVRCSGSPAALGIAAADASFKKFRLSFITTS